MSVGSPVEREHSARPRQLSGKGRLETLTAGSGSDRPTAALDSPPTSDPLPTDFGRPASFCTKPLLPDATMASERHPPAYPPRPRH